MARVYRPRVSFVYKPILTVRNLNLFLLVASVFFLTNSIRRWINPGFANFNVFFYLAVVVLVLRYRGETPLMPLAIWCANAAVVTVTNLVAGVEISRILWALVTYCLPVLVCQLQFNRKINFAQSTDVIMRCVNFFVCCVFVVLLLDFATGSAVMKFIASSALTDLGEWAGTSRRVSIWGHYLTTAIFYLAFYYLNVAYARARRRYLMPAWLVYLITTVGILSTGGKTALVVFLISAVWINMAGRHRFRNALAFTLLILVLYFLGAFDVVLDRFGAADPSGGRYDSLVAMLSRDPLRLFSRYGEDFTRYSTSQVGSFYGLVVMEYSPVGLAYKYGILFVIAEYALLLAPVISASRQSCNWIFLLGMTGLLVCMSSYNGLVYVSDTYLLLAVYVYTVRMLAGNSAQEMLAQGHGGGCFQ
jgi:hypothetical protein